MEMTHPPFRRGTLQRLGDVELITAYHVAWYHQQRLVHRLGRVPPTEPEATYVVEPWPADRQAHRDPRVHGTGDAPARTELSRTGPMIAEAGGGLHRWQAAEQTERADDTDPHPQPLHVAGRIRHR